MKTLYILLIAISMPVAGMTQGNNYFSQPCYTDELWKQACAKDVTLATKRLQMDVLFSEHVNKGLDKPQRSHRSLTDGVITIPVVIYIVHDGATASNISMQAIQSQIDQLNEDFLSYGISFCYAKRNVVDATFFTPAAGDSAGVFRINSPLTNLDIATQDIQLKQLSTLSSKNYLRIFVVNNLSPQGVAGYAFFPWGNDLTDGVVVQANVFGSNNFCAGCPLLSNYNLGHVLTHEVGHYLDLYHTFQGGCDTTNINPLVPACTVTGDWICDTPPTTGNFGCPQPAPLSCNSSTPIMVQNYMDYTNDLCRNSFTTGQNNRMHTAINAYRHLLVSPANLLKTGVQCIDLSHNFADFNCSNFNGCIGRAMGFGALGGTDFTYTWNFGNGNTATGDTVVTTYIAAGQYPVTLAATHNITGVVYTKSQTVFITACYPNTCDRNKLNSGLNFLDFSTGNAVAVSHRRDNQDWPLCTYYQSFTRGDGHGNDFVTINWVNNNLHEVLDSAWNAVDTLGYGLSAYMFPVPGHVNMHCFMHTPWFYNGNIHTAWHDTIAYSIIGNNNGIPYVLPGKKSILLPVAGKTDQRIPFGKVAIIPGCNGTQNWIITVIDDSTLNIMTIDSSATIQLHSIYHPANLRVFSLYSSPNGKRLAVNSFTKNPPITGGTMIFDFNKSTGALTPTNQFIYRGGNCFSPNSRFLYSVSPCCNPEVTTIYQHDLNSLDINASALKVYEFPTDSSNWAGATLFNGADAKTYIGFSRHGNNDADDFRMGLMNFPDKKQDGANAVGFNRLGPQIVPADNTEPGAWSMGFSNVTDGHEAFPCFEIPIKFDWRAHSCFNYRFYSDDCHNATWNFGDAQSGSTNTATGTDVTHTFSGVGIYPVTMVSNGQTSRDTIIITTPQVHIAGTPVLPCPQPFANYSLNTFQAHLKYQWTVTNGTPASALNTGDLNIQWLPGTTGTIKVVAIDAVYGCADSSVITVQIPDTLIATWPGGNDTVQTALQGIALTGGLPPGGVYSGEGVTNNIFYPDSIEGNSATLTYTYTDAYGCVATADRVFVVTGIDNLTLQKSLRIYPQPVNNRLTIECADCDFSNAETYLYDVTGKALITPVQKSHNHIQLQTSNLATGTYVLKLKLADEFAFIRFEKVN